MCIYLFELRTLLYCCLKLILEAFCCWHRCCVHNYNTAVLVLYRKKKKKLEVDVSTASGWLTWTVQCPKIRRHGSYQCIIDCVISWLTCHCSCVCSWRRVYLAPKQLWRFSLGRFRLWLLVLPVSFCFCMGTSHCNVWYKMMQTCNSSSSCNSKFLLIQANCTVMVGLPCFRCILKHQFKPHEPRISLCNSFKPCQAEECVQIQSTSRH